MTDRLLQARVHCRKIGARGRVRSDAEFAADFVAGAGAQGEFKELCGRIASLAPAPVGPGTAS